MTIEELAHITGTTIDVEYTHATRTFTARLKSVDVVTGDRMLRGEFGSGTSPDAALLDYATKLAGQRIRVRDYPVRSADDTSRPDEYPVPKTLAHDVPKTVSLRGS